MNIWVAIAAFIAIAAVVGLLAWVFLRPSATKQRPARLAIVPSKQTQPKSVQRPIKGQETVSEAPRVDVPENTSSSRWVGALIDKHPDEAAEVLKRWIQDK
jgi:flagellar biosynthesis/type III secretory pathway M-ring protein FliF/YscJ